MESEYRNDTAVAVTKPSATMTEAHRRSVTTPTTTPAQTPTTPQTQQLPPLLVTDSWRLANKGLVVTEMPTPPSQESSSDSVFTDPEELASISGTNVPAARSPSERKLPSERTSNKEEKSAFTISRHKKIHLSILSPRISKHHFLDLTRFRVRDSRNGNSLIYHVFCMRTVSHDVLMFSTVLKILKLSSFPTVPPLKDYLYLFGTRDYKSRKSLITYS